MKRRGAVALAMVLAMVGGFLFLSAGVSWAGPHGGVSATVAPDGTVVFSTTTGPATAAIAVSAASYSGLWKNQTEPQKLFKVVAGTIAAGADRLVLHVAVPECDPYQVDAFLGTEVPATITFPEGSGPNGLKGQAYPNAKVCPNSTPTPTPSPSVSATTTMTTHPGPSTGVLGEKLSAGSQLPATGPGLVGPATVLGSGLLLLGLVFLAAARRTRRH
jgi:hypothetical protein